MSEQIKVLAIADSDSYVKWGAALLSHAPPEWDRRMVVLASPVLPSADQLLSALATAGRGFGRPAIVDLSALAVRISRSQPDVVIISVRGPLVKVVVRAIIGATLKRPVIVTGLPGISVPATRMAIAHRAQADLFIVHSRREVREFAALAARMRIDQRFALATVPFLPETTVSKKSADTCLTGDVIFAAQAKVPVAKSDRILLLGWLAESARQHPDRRVVVKVRASPGEHQTHAEAHEYAELMAELSPPAPANMVVEGGPMAVHLDGASGLVTVSSTAALEAVALGRPVLALEDFGIGRSLINTVFEGSGLFGRADDLIAGRFRQPASEWLDDNYFHGIENDDWVAQVTALLAVRSESGFELKLLKRGVAGGRLRRAWDRKRALGRFDRSWSGMIALAVGMPALLTLRSARRIRRAVHSPSRP
jgi:hypothetical protein